MEEKNKGDLLSVRQDIRVVDATVRDGGLVNNFFFADEFVRALFETDKRAGIDYMELGYKASKEIFNEHKFGKWKFCDEDKIWEIVKSEENKEGLKIAVMADVGRCDLKKSATERKNSAIDLYRIATYINSIPSAISMVEHCHKLGYETTVNIMAISKNREDDIANALEMLGQSPVDGIYIVDSFGSLYPEQIRSLADKYLEVAEKYGKFVGIHTHDNQRLAFANTIDATARGVSYLDGTMLAMGRGAGNCAMELLLGFLKNPKYDIRPVLEFLEKYMMPLRKECTWGYDIQYLLTGRMNLHPSAAIEFTKQNRGDYAEFMSELLENE